MNGETKKSAREGAGERDRLFAEALEFAARRIREEMTRFGDAFPGPATAAGAYPIIGNTYWTSSFWTGQLWLAWEATGDEAFRRAAERHYDSYEGRLRERIEVDTHDLGFLYSLSCVAGYRLTGSVRAREAALSAAELLMRRFLPAAGILQAWGPLDQTGHEHRGRMIVDCLMNLPLLRWAAAETGERAYSDAAARHLEKTVAHLIRPDGSTFHTFVFDVADGRPLRGETAQGRSDDSCWSRGQAWAIYGLSLAHLPDADGPLIDTAARAADYFLARLPEDGVCAWDLAPEAAGEERDSSAAAIAVCGLRELADRLGPGDPRAVGYRNQARRILESLCRGYLADRPGDIDGLLLHGVYSKPDGKGVDESCLWGDYFFLEALLGFLRERRNWW